MPTTPTEPEPPERTADVHEVARLIRALPACERAKLRHLLIQPGYQGPTVADKPAGDAKGG